jgi:hypothetical protein
VKKIIIKNNIKAPEIADNVIGIFTSPSSGSGILGQTVLNKYSLV